MVARQMKITRIIVLVLCLLAVFCATTAVAKVAATIDRASLAVDETLTLTISSDSSSLFTDDPDLEPLQKDFKVLGQSQQSSTQIINGSSSSSVSWVITLAPRRAGRLEIPPLSVGKEKTAALNVQVNADAPPKTSDDKVPIFIETAVDEQSVLVQSQLIYTLRVYWATDMQIIDPDAPKVADALVQKLDDTTFAKVINGKSYRVFERKYAIFPQKSGVLEIPQMIIQVNIPSQTSRRNFFDPFGSRGEIVKFRSEGERITVKEKPSEYPASAVWLPSAGLIIKDEWSQDPRQLKVGESVTRSLTITADGLMAEQLPPIELVEPEGVKLYQGKAEVENLTTSAGLVGTRKESIALIPTRPGEIEMPEIRIPWWDKQNRKIEYAVIPAKKITVQGTVAAPETKPLEAVQDNNAETASMKPMVQQPAWQTRQMVLIVLCAVFAVGWLVTLWLLLFTRRQMNELTHLRMKKNEDERVMKEREAHTRFVQACKANDPVQARAAVMSWARAFRPGEKIQTFDDIARILPDSELMSLLHEIDRSLFSRGESLDQWQGKKLLEKVEKVRKERGEKKKDREALQKLYK